MKSTSLKMILASALCATAVQAQTKNVQAQTPSQNGTLTTLDFAKTLQTAPKLWQRSKFFNMDKQQGLQEIINGTKEQLKNPRLQKFGGMDGGGGSAMICESNGVKTTKLVDLFEAEQADIEIDMGEGTFEEKLDYVFKRLSKVSLVHATYYAGLARDLLTKNTQWVENSTMPIVDDIKISTLPKNCTYIQAAVQRPVEQKHLPNSKFFIIDKDLFNLLDEDSKAALILHEVLYRTARYSGIKDSVFVRDLTGLIASNDIKKYNKKTYNQLLEKNGITCLEHDILPLLSPTFTLGASESCDYTMNLNVKFNIPVITHPHRNEVIFRNFKGEMTNPKFGLQNNNLLYNIGETMAPWKQVMETFFSIPGSDHQSLYHSLFSFILNGEFQLTNIAANPSIPAVKVNNSLVSIADSRYSRTIIGNALVDSPYMKIKMISGNIHSNFNNYMLNYSEGTYCGNPCEKHENSFSFELRQYSLYDEDSISQEELKQKEKGSASFLVWVPKELNLEVGGWVEVSKATLDSKGKLLVIAFSKPDEKNNRYSLDVRTGKIQKLNY